MRVYVDTYAGDGTAVLVGYKGPKRIDAPISLSLHSQCPSGVVMDPATFEPVVSHD